MIIMMNKKIHRRCLRESEVIELKARIVADICKEVIAFANTRGGTLYIGVEDNGNVVGGEFIIRMKRTNETLRILFGNVPYEVDSRFRDVDFDIFEMHSYDQLKDTPEYQQWLTGDNDANVPPYGESGAQMRERVLKAFSGIQEDTCIITHGGVIAVIMQHLFPEERKNRYQWQPQNSRGYCIQNNGYQML